MNVLITAGPTREYIDDVRYLSNASTGHMGYALAGAAHAAGHRVTLVHGPTCQTPPAVERVVGVTSAAEMLDAARDAFGNCDALIACAAVSDYRPAERHSGKLKREAAETLSLQLVRNTDIVAELASAKGPEQVVIGFALEAADGEANARRKLSAKGLDAICLNAPEAIGAEATRLTIYFADPAPAPLELDGSKETVAREVIATAERLHAARI